MLTNDPFPNVSESIDRHELTDAGRTSGAVRVRRMMLADLDEVVRIEREIYPFPWTPGNFRDSLRAGYLCWVMTESHDTVCNQRLIGYCVMMQVLDEAHLMNLSVSAAMQRRGHGRRLLLWLMELASARGAHGMFLEVRPSNHAALELYRTLRFERVGLRRNYYPNGGRGREDAVVMRCELRKSDALHSAPGSGAAHPASRAMAGEWQLPPAT